MNTLAIPNDRRKNGSILIGFLVAMMGLLWASNGMGGGDTPATVNTNLPGGPGTNENIIAGYCLADFMETRETVTVAKQPPGVIFSCNVQNAMALEVSGGVVGVFFPRDVRWETDWQTQEFCEGAKLAENRDYLYAKVPSLFRGLKITRGMVDQDVRFRIVFPEITTTTLYLINPAKSIQVKVISRYPACFVTKEAICPDDPAIETAWGAADRLVDFLKFPSAMPIKDEVQTEVSLLRDAEFLYVLARAQMPPDQEAVSSTTQRDGPVWSGDALEFFFRPQPEGKTYYHFAVNPAGALYDAKVDVERDFSRGEEVQETKTMKPEWNTEADVASHWKKGSAEWIVKMKIPLKSMLPSPQDGSAWNVNVARYRAAVGQCSSWAFLGNASSGFHSQDRFGRIIFPPPPGSQPAAWSNWKGGKTDGQVLVPLKRWMTEGLVEETSEGKIMLNAAGAAVAQYLNVPEAGGKRLTISAQFAGENTGAPVWMTLRYEDIDGMRRDIRIFEYIQVTTAMTFYAEDTVIPETARRLVEVRLERGPGAGAVSAEAIRLVIDPLQFNHQVRVCSACQPAVGPTRPPEPGRPELFYWSGRTALSPDCILPIVFGLRLAKPDYRKDGLAVFDLPPELPDPCARTSRHPKNWSGKLEKRGTVVWNGVTYTRYVAPIQLNGGEAPNMQVCLFMKANSYPGRFLRVGYFLEVGGVAYPEQWLDVEVVSIPAGPVPQKYLFVPADNLFGWEYPSLSEAVKLLKYIGFGGVEKWDIHGFDEYRAASIRACQEAGLKPVGEYSPVDYKYSTALRTNLQMQALDIQGKPVMDHDTPKPCPSYRGPEYQEQANILRHFVKYGIDTFTFDEEVFGPGPRICFCERCKGLFKEYLKKNHAKLPDVAMEEIARNTTKYPDHDRAWAEFKADLITQWYRDYRAAAEDEWKKTDPSRKVTIYVTSQTMATGAGAGYGSTEFMNCLRDNAARFREGIIQGLMPMAYLYGASYGGSVRKVGRDYIDLQKLWGPYMNGKPALFPYFLAGGSGMCFLEPQRVIKYTLYEAVTSGAISGGVFFHTGGLDGYHYKYLAEALHAIARVEDILFGGAMEELVCDTPGAEARIIRNKDQAVIFVSHYGYEPVEVAVKFSPPCKMAVTDPETEEKVMTLEPDAKSIPVKIGVNRARLLKLSPAPVSDSGSSKK